MNEKIDKDKDSISNTERLEESFEKYLSLLSMGTKGKLVIDELKHMDELLTSEIEELKEDLTTEYFCSICINDLEDTPKVLKRHRTDIYTHVFYCGNCENYFIIDNDKIPKKIHEELKKYYIYL